MKYDDFFYMPMGKEILEEEAKFVAEHIDGIVASIGCGTGIIEKRIKEISKAKILGIEIDDEMLKEARERIDVIKAYAEKLPFKNSSFDAVIFITSLEFIEDYKKAINEAWRILKNKGRIVAIILNTSSPYFKQRYEKGGYISKNIKHMDISKIEKELKEKFWVKRKNLLRNIAYGMVGMIEK